MNIDLPAIIAVSGTFLIGLLLVVGGLVIAGIKALRGGGTKKTRAVDADETKLIQQIHQGLGRMEERIDALETILLDRGRKDKQP